MRRFASENPRSIHHLSAAGSPPAGRPPVGADVRRGAGAAAGPRTEARAVTLPPGANVAVELERPAAAQVRAPAGSRPWRRSPRPTRPRIWLHWPPSAASATWTWRPGTARVILEMDVDPQAHPDGRADLVRAGGVAQRADWPPSSTRAAIGHASRPGGRDRCHRRELRDRRTTSWVQVLAPFSQPGGAELRSKGCATCASLSRCSSKKCPSACRPRASVARCRRRPVGAQTSEGVSLTGIGDWHSGGLGRHGDQSGGVRLKASPTGRRARPAATCRQVP
jgi:hypothetical protein